MTDRKWIRRAAAEYADAFNNLLPTGPAWPRQDGAVLQEFLAGLSEIWGDPVERLAALLLETESDPRATFLLLPEWERAWGLPDPCLDEPVTIAARQKALVTKMTYMGGQSREFFIGVAAEIGYEITIREFSPFMCGYSRCGDTRDLDDGVHYRWEIGPPKMRFYWVVHVDTTRLLWFRAASGQAGVDPMVHIGLATDLECILRRWKPAHTILIFDYSSESGLDYSLPQDAVFMLLNLP